ncbi:Transglycosylase, Slt family [Oleidesulfovibrio alaskensis]|jgi:membrane-bound lytic murein transglycosylase F
MGKRLLAALSVTVLSILLSCSEREKQPVQPDNTLRVVAPHRERVSSALSPYGPGYEHELVMHFARQAGYDIEWIEASTMEDALQALAERRGDLIVGYGGDITAAPQTTTRHNDAPPPSPVVSGPAYGHYNPVLVHSTRRYGLRRGNEMCDTPVLVTADPELEEILEAKADTLECVPMTEASQDVYLTPILQSLDTNSARFAMLDNLGYSLWQPFYPGVRTAKVLTQKIPYRWFWRGDDARLNEAALSFWAQRENDSLLDDMQERYFGFLPEEVDRYDVALLRRALESKVPQYAQAIGNAAREQSIDPLLLIAVIYQESRFDADARSKTGVRGLMMVTQDTARLLGINRLDPEQSIRGGARYLRMLWDSLEDMELDPWNRWFFTLAAYNQGPGHLFDAIKLSRARGGTGRTWRELKEVYPLLAWERWYSRTKHGYCRGFEAVAYVENIRFYYYILNGLLTLARPETEDLGPLLSGLPPDWPVGAGT